MVKLCKGLQAGFGGIRGKVGVIAAGLVVMSSAALADPPTYVTDIGIDPEEVITGLTSVLAPFLIATITIGFGFFAVKKGVRWIKGMAS